MHAPSKSQCILCEYSRLPEAQDLTIHVRTLKVTMYSLLILSPSRGSADQPTPALQVTTHYSLLLSMLANLPQSRNVFFANTLGLDRPCTHPQSHNVFFTNTFALSSLTQPCMRSRCILTTTLAVYRLDRPVTTYSSSPISLPRFSDVPARL